MHRLKMPGIVKGAQPSKAFKEADCHYGTYDACQKDSLGEYMGLPDSLHPRSCQEAFQQATFW